jgi:hypothetical protein
MLNEPLVVKKSALLDNPLQILTIHGGILKSTPKAFVVTATETNGRVPGIS